MDNTKKKFVIRYDLNSDNTHNLFQCSDIVDMESQLKKATLTKDKTPITNMNHNSNSNYGSTFSAGRGFGNLNIANELRGDSSRSDTKEYREYRETQDIASHKFSFLDRNFQDPFHIVMPIPRGGESTRKQNQLNVDTMRNPKELVTSNKKKIDFKY
jgi:hypothetical protein